MPSGGLLGIPFPLYAAVDKGLSSLIGAIGALIVWSLLCSSVVLFLYRFCSPQKKLRVIKDRMREIAGELNKNPDDLSLLLRLSGENIKIAFTRFLLTFLPTCLAIIPLISLATWLNSNYGYEAPPLEGTVVVTALPEGTKIGVDTASAKTSTTNAVNFAEGSTGFVLYDEDGQLLTKVSLPPIGTSVSRKSGWNLLLGNPMGYLPKDCAVDTVLIDFNRREFLGFGPEWIRGWETIFLLGMTVFSLVFKVAFKVE